jgi:membrane-associated phospholipid phosphatase
MKITLARIVSIILHPLIMPSVGMILLFNSGTYLDFLSFTQKRAIFLILFTGTAVLPLSLIPLMIVNRIVRNLKMEDHRERVLPLMIAVLFYGFTWYILARLDVPGLVSIYIITASITILLSALVSIKWKISLHTTAIGALTGVLLAVAFRFNINLLLYLSLVFLGGGIAGWARLSLGAHTPSQVYLGYVGGLALAFFLMYNF